MHTAACVPKAAAVSYQQARLLAAITLDGADADILNSWQTLLCVIETTFKLTLGLLTLWNVRQSTSAAHRISNGRDGLGWT